MKHIAVRAEGKELSQVVGFDVILQEYCSVILQPVLSRLLDVTLEAAPRDPVVRLQITGGTMPSSNCVQSRISWQTG